MLFNRLLCSCMLFNRPIYPEANLQITSHLLTRYEVAVTLSLFTCSGWADTLRAVFPLTSDVDGRSPFTVATPCRMIEPKRLILVLFSAVQALRGARTCTRSKARHIMCQSLTQRNTSASARGHLPSIFTRPIAIARTSNTRHFEVLGTPKRS